LTSPPTTMPMRPSPSRGRGPRHSPSLPIADSTTTRRRSARPPIHATPATPCAADRVAWPATPRGSTLRFAPHRPPFVRVHPCRRPSCHEPTTSLPLQRGRATEQAPNSARTSRGSRMSACCAPAIPSHSARSAAPSLRVAANRPKPIPCSLDVFFPSALSATAPASLFPAHSHAHFPHRRPGPRRPRGLHFPTHSCAQPSRALRARGLLKRREKFKSPPHRRCKIAQNSPKRPEVPPSFGKMGAIGAILRTEPFAFRPKRAPLCG